MDVVAGLLNRERVLLELLVFKLVELRQLLQCGETRFLGWAAEEVERATASVRSAELERAVLVASLADERGVDEEALSLAELAATADEPWRSIFDDHRSALRALAAEAEELLGANRRLARSGGKAVADTLERLSGQGAAPEPATTTYGPGGAWQTSAPAPRVARTL